MVLPAAAGAVQVEAVGCVATVGGSLRTDASAGQIRGGPGGGGCSGGASPLRPPPPAFEEGAVLHGQGKRRAAVASSSSSSSEPPRTPALQLAVANELITRFAMAQEKRSLSDAELSLVKFLLCRIPGLEAEAAAEEACGGEHSPRWGFMVGAPLRLACLLRRSIERRAAPPPRRPLSPSSEEEILTPAPHLEIAKEVVRRLSSLVEFLEDRVPGLKAASGVCRGGAARVHSKVAPSGRARAPAKASCAVAVAKGNPAVAVNSLPVATLRRPEQVATPAVAHVIIDRQVVTKHSGEEDAHAIFGVHNNMSEANVSHEHHRGQEFSSEHESFSSLSSIEEPPTPEVEVEIAKEVTSCLTMAREKCMLSADEHSLIKSLEDRIPGLEAEVPSGVGDGGAIPSPPKVAPSGHAHAPAKASCAVAASLSPVHNLRRPWLCASLVHPLSHQVATPAAPITIGRQVITRDSGEEDAHATSGVQISMSDANASHEHHRGEELSSEHESLLSSLSFTSEENHTPALQLKIAKELIRRFTMAQEKRMLSASELSLIKFLEDRILGLEAEAALGACSGQHPVRRGFMVATPVWWAWLHRESIGRRAAPCHHPSSSEEPLTPEIQLEIASEVINRLAVAQGRRMLSASELSLIKFLGDRIPYLEAATSGVRGGTTPSQSEVAPSRSQVRAKICCHAASMSSLVVATVLEQVSMPAANVTAGRQVATRHSGEEDAHANAIVVDGNSSLPSSSSEEPLTPEIQLEIAKDVISQLVMAQEKRMLSADEHALIKFLEDRIPGLEAATGVHSGETRPLSKVASSCLARAKARRIIIATLSSTADNLHRPGLCTPMVHPLSHQDAMPAAHVTVGQQVVIRHSGEEDAHATSAVHKMSDANFSHEHHRGGQELSIEHKSLFSSLSSSSEESLTPALQLEIAKELIRRFTMAQEKRMLSAGELSLIKFLEDRILGLEAEAALGACSGQHPVRRGFMVATPVRWAWLHRENIGRRAAPCHRPSTSEEPLTPEIQLEIASEVINRLAVAQERRMLSGSELSLIKFLGDRIPDLEAATSGMRGGATPSQSEVAPSRCQVRAKIRCHAASMSSLVVATLLEQVSTPAANVTAGRQVATRNSGEEDAHANSTVFDGNSSLPSSSEEPLTPEIQLEIAKDVISQLVMAQEKRMLSADEHALIKFLEDRIPGLEAATGVHSGETQSLSKVASSCLARAKARRVIIATLSSTADNLHRPGLCAPMVHPLSHQDAMPAAHVSIGEQVVIRHSGEEDAHATSAVHKMSDANFSHEHHRGGQELSSEDESFLEKHDSGCDLGVVTEKSSTTIAPEMAPPPSDGDNTAESSGVSSHWGTAPDAEGFNDFGLPDDLGLY